MKLGTLAQVVRSKNAGPFRVTLDIFFETKKNYLLVKNSGVLKQSRIANLYRIPETDVLGIYFADNARGIKITLLRNASSGSFDDTDVYGAQQHAPLLSILIPFDE